MNSHDTRPWYPHCAAGVWWPESMPIGQAIPSCLWTSRCSCGARPGVTPDRLQDFSYTCMYIDGIRMYKSSICSIVLWYVYTFLSSLFPIWSIGHKSQWPRPTGVFGRCWLDFSGFVKHCQPECWFQERLRHMLRTGQKERVKKDLRRKPFS